MDEKLLPVLRMYNLFMHLKTKNEELEYQFLKETGKPVNAENKKRF